MLRKRIIPCLDIQNGRTVKGVNFEGLKDAGDPLILAMKYASEGADELVFLDIAATNEERSTLVDLVGSISKVINIPFTIGGGVRSVEDVKKLLSAGADKIAINSAAIKDPELIKNLANEFGSQCIVVAIDIKFENDEWFVYLNGGRVRTEWKALEWAKRVCEWGAGEILLTSMSNDGTQNGFALDITREISSSIPIPVIASGGAGEMEHFYEVLKNGQADAVLAASVFHYNTIGIPELKKYLNEKKIEIRI